jgi:hypothetical protein
LTVSKEHQFVPLSHLIHFICNTKGILYGWDGSVVRAS